MSKYYKGFSLISLIILSLFSISLESESIESTYEWGPLYIGGGGFVSGIVVGQKEMYLRTDVGGAYKYDYDNKKWVQLFGFLNEAKKGFLSVSGIAIDPKDDNIVYFLCGCAYFSDAKTSIFNLLDLIIKFIENNKELKQLMVEKLSLKLM